jgi:hypothetical protein
MILEVAQYAKMDALLQKLIKFDKSLSELRIDERYNFKNIVLRRTIFGLKAVAYINDFHVLLPDRYADRFTESDLGYIWQRHLCMVNGGKKIKGNRVFYNIRFEAFRANN